MDPLSLILLFLFSILLTILLLGIRIMASATEILSKLSEANGHLDQLIAQGTNSIPPAQSDEILTAATALDTKITGAIVP